MGYRRTIAAGIAFAAAVGLYLYDGARITRLESERLRASRMLKFGADAITEISILRSGQPLDLRREGGEWKIIRPAQTTADPQAAHDLLFYLDRQEITKGDLYEPADLGSIGLAEPALRVTVGALGGAGEEFTLLVGDDSPVAGEVYARTPERSAAFTIAAGLRDQLTKSLYEYRDKRLLDVNATEAGRLSFTIQGATIDLEKSAEGWRITRPANLKAEDERVEGILREIHMTTALDFVDTDTLDLSAYGLAANPMVTAVETGSGEETRRASLLVGRRRITDGKDKKDEEPRYYALRLGRDEVFTVPQSLVAKLRPTVQDLRSRAIFTLAADDVTSFTLEFGPRRVQLRREKGARWRFAEGGDGEQLKADEDFATAVVRLMLATRVAHYFPEAPDAEKTGLEKPLLRMIATAEDGKTEGIETGMTVDGEKLVYAKTIGAREVFAVAGDMPGKFFLSTQDFEDHTLHAFDPALVTSIELAAQNKTLTVRREGELWFGQYSGDEKRFQLRPTDVETAILQARALKWKRRLNPALDADREAIEKFDMDDPKDVFRFYDEERTELAYIGTCGNDERFVYIRGPGEDHYFAIDPLDYVVFIKALGPLAPKI